MKTRSSGDNNKAPRRSRTGCITCKIRRVKCDETRPECQRCTSTGRTCDGYPAAGVPSQHSTRRALATAVRQLQVVGPAARVLGKPLPVDDVACFDFFRVCTASMTGSVFPGEKFWSMQMLQAAHAEPAVMKAAVALGAFHRRWEYSNYCLNPNVTRRPGPQRDNTDVLQFTHQAFKHYGASLALAKQVTDPNMLAILSVALGAAAHLAGRWRDSQVHIRAGLRILREMKSQIRPSDLEGAAQALERLDAQAMTLSDATSPYEYTKSVLEDAKRLLLISPDQRHPGPEEEKNSLLGPMNDLGQAAMAVFRLMRQFFIIADAVTTGGITPREFEQARVQMVEATARWERQMAMLVSIHESKYKFASDREYNKRDQKVLILSLRLYQVTVQLIVYAHGTPPGVAPDVSGDANQQEDGFNEIVDFDGQPTGISGTGDAHDNGAARASAGGQFLYQSLGTQSRYFDPGPLATEGSDTHVGLNSHLGKAFTQNITANGSSPLPSWASKDPSVLPSPPSTTGTSSEGTKHLRINKSPSTSHSSTNAGPPGLCANPGLGHRKLSTNPRSRSTSKPLISSGCSSASLGGTIYPNPPQIQPKAPLAPSSPTPILAVPSRSPSPLPLASTSSLSSPGHCSYNQNPIQVRAVPCQPPFQTKSLSVSESLLSGSSFPDDASMSTTPSLFSTQDHMQHSDPYLNGSNSSTLPTEQESPNMLEPTPESEPEPDPEEEIQIPTSETRWDALHAYFDVIVNLASEIAVNTDSPLPFFMSLEPGLAMPLYLTVKRCRHPVTRRRALGLLRRLNRQEGIWNCAIAARAAEEIIILEEEGLIRSWSCEHTNESPDSVIGDENGDEEMRRRDTGLLLPLDIFEHVPIYNSENNHDDEQSNKTKGILEHYKSLAIDKARQATKGRHDGMMIFWPDGWPNIPEEKRILVQYPIFRLEQNQLELLMFVMGDMGQNGGGGGGEEKGGAGRMARRVIVDLF